ncbi:hypothetical protein HMPREF1544_10059 [Mucor circinelloides 1006PhL]|uniref:DH domain-containing protein n=1 Tax=Mucor circinelloides f. circinelloides (strain 1006PhL) TaxID=1220926 RepID=S2IZL4_MUCC1|nr:hypothetical protein HMPREF1544_10059 [Mucor circinelloides 1006PhL]
MSYPEVQYTIESWLNSSNEFSDQDKTLNKQLPSALLSNLSSIFVSTVAYFNLTKQEALDTIAYFLYEHQDIVHSQLLDSFLDHGLLTSNHASQLKINYNIACSGIFIPLTKCYSPSCQPNDVSCYSALCPNKRMSGLLHIYNDCHHHHQQQQQQEEAPNPQASQKDWISTIPHHIRNSVCRKELKRQAGIAELLSTEQNYCHDLDILHRVYAIPLLESTEIIVNPSRRQRFYNNVFGNYLDITHLHHSFYQRLVSHNRHSGFFIGRVGTIIMQHVTNLIEPYIQYASNHVKAIYCMTIEHRNNPQFASFLETQNAQKCTRRLGLRHYLTSPTLWIGKLKLLIEAILKNTVDDADQLSLKATLAILHDTLCRMNSSATANSSPEDFRFEELSTSIYYGQQAELQLLSLPDDCTLIKEEALWLARSTHPLQPSLCHLMLFSHALILTHPRVSNGRTEYIVIQVIPIQLLMIDSNASSMIRRISFASTSMVSTPLHLISNLRRQKSINSEASNGTDSADSSDSFYKSNMALSRSNTTGGTAASVKHVHAVSLSDRKNRVLLPLQIKTKLSKLKNNFRWSTSFSVPASPTTALEGSPNEVSVTRRDSAPALLLSKRREEPSDTSNQQQQSRHQQQQQRRTLKISHMAYPESSFKLEFLSRSDRLVWENLIRNTLIANEKENQVFKRKILFKSLSAVNASLNGSNSSTQAPSAHVTSIARIKCAYAFAYFDKHTGFHRDLVAFGTPYGLWIGSRDGSTQPQLVLPNVNVQKMAVLNDKIITQVHDNKQHMLIAYDIKPLIESQHVDWCMIKRSSVICFAIGQIRNQPVIVYLTRRLQTTWLVIIVQNEKPCTRNHWYKKYRTEYLVSIKEPNDIQIMYDAVIVRSERYGVERVDIFKDPSTILNSMTHWVYLGMNTGLITYKDRGIVCDHQHAYSVSLFESGGALVKIKFECQLQQVAIVYPYLVAFSPNVIEIRDIETTELVQAIRGQRIRFISTTNDYSQPLYYTMANTADPRVTSIYQLQLAL